jgi:hypothetical protein
MLIIHPESNRRVNQLRFSHQCPSMLRRNIYFSSQVDDHIVHIVVSNLSTKVNFLACPPFRRYLIHKSTQ